MPERIYYIYMYIHIYRYQSLYTYLGNTYLHIAATNTIMNTIMINIPTATGTAMTTTDISIAVVGPADGSTKWYV